MDSCKGVIMIINKSCFLSCLILFLIVVNFTFATGQDSLHLNLNECISLALRNNFDLQIEKQQVREVQTIVKQLQAARLPQFNFQASYLRFSEVMEANISPQIEGLPFQIDPMHLRFGDENNYMTKFNISQLVFAGFKIKNNIKASKNQLKATEFNEKIQINNLSFKLTQNYFNLISAQKLKEVAILSQHAIEAHLKDVKNLLSQGIINKNEVLKVEIKKSEIELLTNQAENRIELLKKMLLSLMGMDINTNISIQEKLLFKPDSLKYEDAVNNAKQMRPELNQINYYLKSNQNLVQSAKGNFLPTLSLIGNYEYGKPGLNKFENKWMGYWTLGIVAQWNIWDWGIKKSQIEKAQVGLKRLQFAQKKLQQSIELDVQNALLKENEAKKRVLICQQTKDQATENFRLVKNQFEQGLVTNTEFLDAETQLTKTKIDELRAIADYNIAIADVERAMGNAVVK